MYSAEINDLSAADRFFPDLISYTAIRLFGTQIIIY